MWKELHTKVCCIKHSRSFDVTTIDKCRKGLRAVKSNFPVMDEDASALTDAVAGCGINQRYAGSNDGGVQSPRKKRVHLEASSIGENPFRAKKNHQRWLG
jgi:hypothetical protein